MIAAVYVIGFTVTWGVVARYLIRSSPPPMRGWGDAVADCLGAVLPSLLWPVTWIAMGMAWLLRRGSSA